MFCVRLAKKERTYYAYRMVALLGLTLGFFVLVQFLNAPSPIAAQEQPTPEITVTLRTTPCSPNNATFVGDVTIVDGQILKRNESFIKTWRVRNPGPCAWPSGYSIRFLPGFSNLGTDSAPLPLADPGQEVDISLQLVAPSQAGPYRSVWGLFDSAGLQFGTPLTISIAVSPDLAAATSTPTVVPTQSPSPIPSPTETVVTPSVPSEPVLEASTPSADATAITEVGTESDEETPTENSQSSVGRIILLLILVVLLLIALVLILLRWQFTNASRRVSKRAGAKTSPAKKPQPVEWNLDLEPPIPLPATLSQPPQGVPYLESLDSSKEPVYFALNQPVSRVGRGEENELRIDDSFMGWQTVSRHHAKIERDGENSILIDTNSSHGTQVDGRHSNTNLLQNDCIISFGLVKFAFRNPPTTHH